MDKKKTPFANSGFQSVVGKNIPQQMNGSDWGMFTCKVIIDLDLEMNDRNQG